MIETLAALKRALPVGAKLTLVHRAYPPLRGGFDATGITRRVVIVQNNAIAIESIRPDTDKPSWLYWPKASDVSFSTDGAAQLFTVKGLTYRVEAEQ